MEGNPTKQEDEDEEFGAEVDNEEEDREEQKEANDEMDEEAEEVNDEEENEEGDDAIKDDDVKDDGDDLLDEDSEGASNIKPAKSSKLSKQKKNILDDDDEEEEEVVNKDSSKLDTTFVAGWKSSDGKVKTAVQKLRKNKIMDDDEDDNEENDLDGEDGDDEGEKDGDNEDDEEENLDKTRDLLDDEDGIGQNRMQIEDDEDDDEPIRFTGKRRRRAELDAKRQKKSKIRSYYSRGKITRMSFLIYHNNLTRITCSSTIAITHASPTALMLLPQIRTKFSAYGHIPLDIMWQAILGITDQYTRGRSPEDIYDSYCDYLKVINI